MMSDDRKTLRMSGLSPTTEQVCRTIYHEFLKHHNLESYPVKIAVIPTSKQYHVDIVVGDFGIDHTGDSRLIDTPEAYIEETLRKELEDHYKRHQGQSQNV